MIETCPGCGGSFVSVEGATHPYMLSSPACWAKYGEILAREYLDGALLATHRLSVDTYAVQHSGGDDRRAVQSVGLHLARMMLQFDSPLTPRETNDIMLGLSHTKSSLPFLKPPTSFSFTVADIPIDVTAEAHTVLVRRWAAETWSAWSAHHEFVRQWTEAARGQG